MSLEDVTISNTGSELESLLEPLKKAISAILYDDCLSETLPDEEVGYYFEMFRWLTRAKIYVPLTFEADSIPGSLRKKPKGDKLLSQEDTVRQIWKIINEELCHFIDDRINQLLDKASRGEDFEGKIVCFWRELFEKDIRTRSTNLHMACQYMNDNFSYIFAEFPVRSVYEYAEFYTAKLLASALGTRGKSTMERFLEEYRDYGDTICDLDAGGGGEYFGKSSTNPLRLMNKHKITLDRGGQLSVKEFYLCNIGTISRHEMKIMINDEYIQNLKKVIAREENVAASISKDFCYEAKTTILMNTLLQPDTLKKLIPSFALRKDKEKEYEMIRLSYLSAGKNKDFYEIMYETVSEHFKSAYVLHHDVNEILSCCIALYSHKNSESSAIIKQGLRRTFGGELNLIDPLLKDLDSRIKRCYQALTTHATVPDAQSEDNRNKLDVTWKILDEFGLKEAFLKLYLERSLFRRILLMGDNFLNFMDHPDNMEMGMVDSLLLGGENLAALTQLGSLKSDLRKVNDLVKHFQILSESGIRIVPMLFERNNVPITFQEMNLKGLDLPSNLRVLWNSFIDFYKMDDVKANFKSVNLQHMLHHLEVMTQYKVGPHQYLILELTLLQSCILELFNDNDKLCFEDILSTLKVPTAYLELALNSFTDIKLLNRSDGLYVLNLHFRPDKKKIRNGRLRIAHRSLPTSKTNSKDSGRSPKGNDSIWRKELMLSCIIRLLKGEQVGHTYSGLLELVNKEISGFSVGEFKAALSECEDYYKIENGLYFYRP